MNLGQFFSLFRGKSAPDAASASASSGVTLSRLNTAGNYGPAVPERVTGPPTSSNGASSFHLWLEAPKRPLIAYRATIEVLEPPTVDRLFFWALQVSFVKGNQNLGAGHFGIQNYDLHPNSCAVNWGGYTANGAQIPGSRSDLPSAPNNVNSRDYQWVAGRKYRYEIAPSPKAGWEGSITDLTTGEKTVVRELHIDADGIKSPVVWTEAFAYCEDPSTAVRWTDMHGIAADGSVVGATYGKTNYQSHADGGCANTTFEPSEGGVIQRTGTRRLVNGGARISLEPRISLELEDERDIL